MFSTKFPANLKLLRTTLCVPLRNSTSTIFKKGPVVTIIDASCKIGRHVALLLKQSPHIGELRLYDKNSDICVVAEDLSHIDTKTKVRSFSGGSVLKNAVTDADIVIAVGGCKASHKETLNEQFDKNVDDIRTVALHMIEFNPKAIFCITKPPIEALVPLVSEEYKKAGVYDSRKIIGVTSVASMRANHFIASTTGQNAAEVLCPIVGGLSSECLVAVLSQYKPNVSLRQKHGDLQNSIAKGEEDVLKLYADAGMVCLTPALAISRFINMLSKALKGEVNCVDCAFVRQTGHIGQYLPYMTSIIRFGRHGVMSSHMPKVNGEEAHLLKKKALVLRNLIRMGESFVTGETETDEPSKEKSESKKVEADQKVIQKSV